MLIEGPWIAPVTPTMMVILGLPVHPLSRIAWVSRLYLLAFQLMAVEGNPSWHKYCKSMPKYFTRNDQFLLITK